MQWASTFEPRHGNLTAFVSSLSDEECREVTFLEECSGGSLLKISTNTGAQMLKLAMVSDCSSQSSTKRLKLQPFTLTTALVRTQG